MIAEDVKSHLKKIAHSLNTYIESNDFKYMVEIETYLEQFFDAQSVKFWHYDAKEMQITLLDNVKNNVLKLSSSLTQQVIKSKTACIENHATSNKYFNTQIDNPLGLKIKALLFFPIVKGNKVIGIVKLWRGLHQKKNFVKKDESNLSLFAPLFLDVLERKTIDKNDLFELLNEKTNTKSISKEHSEKKSVSNDGHALQELQATFEVFKKENSTIITDLNSELSYAKEKETSQKESIELLKIQLDKLQEEYKVLEESSVELYAESQKYQQKISQLDDLNKVLSTDNKVFKKELKKMKDNTQTNSIKALKSERALVSTANIFDIDSNVEHIFEKIDTRFNENEYAHTVFDIFTYALSSKKGMNNIEEILKKSKVTQQLIDGYYFKGDLVLRQEKHRIEHFVHQITKYEKEVFTNMTFDVVINKSVPTSLVLDAAKIQNIIFHLLVDLYQFVDHSKTIDIHFDFKKKFLTIELGGSIHRKNSLFESMFKQNKLGGDEKDRVGLQVSKKVISRLKGELNTHYEDDYYKFILILPAQVIKM